ncbi:hypothetical protein A3D71_00705 [Candidatus Kaiserbacteria bacterium RIFCSPHIGHO2_02_FULL_55_20]|uniref:Uncharacterized protein n=1 Tax=Candidatus Kaiserbacteria bacterium RIFCSPHIGHO2_02_FULL_55_20 TaxID=1798497 RepID=A0A1F6DWR5_9BACT|nr:MAG: hypothetical protein A2680_00725 [Candidatus Kaiserbacteria bacterium RIFCSPHIGHO2_01_FULL_55_37]OGG65875.1 MAG: hypothetical protein A3D71_00705 [Candidatus Kaiserbacteria bacterium RIFCSPHIGHO2_02_FULL_55_20]
MTLLLKRPAAWIPIALSLGMLAFILIYIATYGISPPTPDADEGTPAHLFQLWLVLEALMIVFFAIKWLSRNLKEALKVLALQIAAVLPPVATVLFLEH